MVETLVSMALLGAILIPILFMSSSFFTNQLLRTRNAIEVGHNTSHFINRFTDELYKAQRVLPYVLDGATTVNSDSTHIFFSYYDPVKQREVKSGYQLTTSGSNRVLERMVYNSGSGTWSVISPYSSTESDQILLPGAAVFEYCLDAATPNCTTTANPERALLIRLSDWTFSKSTGTQTVSLPRVDVYVGAGATRGNSLLLAEQARQLFSFSTTDAYGADADPAMSYLAPDGSRLFSLVNGGVGTAGDGGLVTVVSDGVYPGCYGDHVSDIYSIAATSTGRVVFGENNATGRVWTWASSTGLSTLVTGENSPGKANMIVDSGNRFYFGEEGAPSTLWTWKEGVGLSTIGDMNFTNVAFKNIKPDPAGGRIYFGGIVRFMTWKENGTGAGILSTIIAPPTDVNYPGRNSMRVRSDGAVFFGEDENPGRFWFWEDDNSPGGVLSTIIDDGLYPGYAATTLAPDGRIFFCDNEAASSAACRTWKEGVGLSTIATGLNDPASYGSIAIDPATSRVFIGTSDNNVLTWEESAGLSTISSGVAKQGLKFNGDLAYIGGQQTIFRVWKDDNTGSGRLSTIITNVSSVGRRNMVVSPDGTVFFARWSSGNTGMAWVWKDNGTGAGALTTIISPAQHEVGYRSASFAPDGRLFFGQYTTSGSFWTWKSDTGLSTLVDGAYQPGYDCMLVGGDGRVYFGENTTSNARFWTWKDGSSEASPGGISQASQFGSSTGQAKEIQLTGSPTFVAVETDSAQNLYFIDSVGKTLDVYKKAPSTYTLSTQMNWTTWATTVGALAVDEASTAISLLDTGNKQIDRYANRFTSGTPSAPTQFSVAGQVTTPTGLEISDRTGNYLVIDSNVLGAGAGKYINLAIYNGQTNAYIKSIPIVVTTANLSVDASAETNFKILLDANQNILYLTAPTLNRVFALAMPELL